MVDVSSNNHYSKMKLDEVIEEILHINKSHPVKSAGYSIVSNIKKHGDKLETAHEFLVSLSGKKKLASSGVEWFLDNYYAIQEAVELIQDDLPRDYFGKLPAIGSDQPMPRAYLIARAIVAHYEVEVVQDDLNDFLNALQSQLPLKMSELWALPLFLRLALIEVLAGTIFELIDDKDSKITTDHVKFSSIDSDEIVARSLRTLILFDRIDWRSFFEDHSIVEQILRKDPANVYANMDFDTRDEFRKKIEFLANHSETTEEEIAQIVLTLAEQNSGKHKKEAHVGFYLVDKGEEQLKTEINFSGSYSDRLKDLFFSHNVLFYLGGITLLTLLVTVGLTSVSSIFLTKTWQRIFIAIISILPASSVAVNLLNSILTAALPPRLLPKMDFSKRIPKEFRTMLVVPALLANEDDINFLLRQLELHYLANKDRNLGFALLSDFGDAPQEMMPEDGILLEKIINGINALNQRYRGDQGRRPFYLFHRRRQWNPQEYCWLGWERKRGKLADFNRFILEGFTDSFDTIIGEVEFVKSTKFVITVDSDTIVPRDSANALIATLAHPLNQAEFDENTGKVVSGYTILQPRTEVKPTSVNRTFFTHVFAGDLGLDLYTRAVSDVYQDLFAEGIFVGKGIYDVAAFHRSIAGKVPNNALLSHDLFEGLQGRAALVTDIIFFEEYPPNYASQIQRKHRWVRGDWQLLPWLFPKVPAAANKKIKNTFDAIDLWKIFDNLRRSLLEPAFLAAFVLGWMMFKKDAWIWTLLIFFISAFPLFYNIVAALSSRIILGAKTYLISNIWTAFLRWLLWLVFLPYEALLMFDAIVTTLIRVFISHKRLLQWQTAAHTIRLFGKQHKIGIFWQKMIGAPLITALIGVVLVLIDPSAYYCCIPLLLMWIISPQIAYWISLAPDKKAMNDLPEADLQRLRGIARRTWLYFERFIGPEDHWLPPDHYQQDPKGTVAHRTSPTNIGLMLLSTASAYDFGYIGILDYIYRLNYSFETLDELEKYRGHLLNWYDTTTLGTLTPRYVSTVDSGNFATSLIGLYQALKDLNNDNICPDILFSGIYDTLFVFCEVIGELNSGTLVEFVQPLMDHCRNVQEDIKDRRLKDTPKLELLSGFQERLSEPMNLLIKEILNKDHAVEKVKLQELRYWSEAIFQQSANFQRQIEMLTPWADAWQHRPDFFDQIESDEWRNIFAKWYEDVSLQMPISQIPDMCQETKDKIKEVRDQTEIPGLSSLTEKQVHEFNEWLDIFVKALEESKASIENLLTQIEHLLEKINFYIERHEFDFLYDQQREVFYLGYQVGSGRLDKNHYDLLASEARTASLFAIAKNEVPRSHWLHMGRPFTIISGIPTLISWNGSMFEYLMPNLFTRTYPETLLDETSQGVVKAQIEYAKKQNVPWGISESSYYRFDNAQNYQYQGFGVPGLGRKRGLADDLVIAPYASLIAVGVDPYAVLENLDSLKEEGALGQFGFFESIDYTASRLPVGKDKAVIKSYMAHHQGMIMLALSNFLNPRTIVDRVHADPLIQSTELLLQEQIPQAESQKPTTDQKITTRGIDAEQVNTSPWVIDQNLPNHAVHVLSNSDLRLMMTDTGSGYLAWKDIALTRWREDATLDAWGIWFYLQNLKDGRTWSIGKRPVDGQPQEYRVVFSPHMTEIRHVSDDIRVIMQTTISSNDDVCLHKITFTNQSNEEKYYRILSYGEVVLAPLSTDRQHPAFNKMFIESEFIDEINMLYFQRRKRSSEEEPLAMAHFIYDDNKDEIEYEGDREKFIGRGHDFSNPLVLSKKKSLSGTVGITLDPIFSIGKRLRLLPNQSKTITYMTLAAENKEKAKSIARKYSNSHRIDNAFAAAQSQTEKLLRSLDLDSQKLSKFQALLSHIIYPTPRLRSAPELLRDNVLSQSGLWSFGISGDYPILLAMIDREDDVSPLQELLMAHTYWRKLGLKIDLVILNTKDTGYTNELNERIHQAINVMDSQSWVNQRGGIFVVTANQINQEALTLIKTSARVVIDLRDQNIDRRLSHAKSTEPSLPLFVPSEPDKDFSTGETVSRPENLILDNGIGGFTPDGKEYQIFIKNYHATLKGEGQITPAPWINVIANEQFGCLINESGGGYTWSQNSGENRLTPWTNDPVSDPSGETLYLRDELTGKIWSPTPYPSGESANYLIRHGQGYSIFQSHNQGFEQKLSVFVDPNSLVKIIKLTLTNKTEESRRITATYFAEWVLGPDRENTKLYILPTFDDHTGTLLARNSYSAEFSEQVAFLTSNLPVHGLTTDRREFLGFPGNRHAPAGLKRIGLSGKVEAGQDPCAALQTHLNFSPGEEKTVIFVLGQGENHAEAVKLAGEFADDNQAEESLNNAIQMWEDHLRTIEVETPDRALNIVLNRWLQYQALSCRIWGRSAFYQSSGAYGFRDQLQDVTSLLAHQPEIAREHILRAAHHQFDAGDVLHWWHPPSGRGVRTRISDDLLWLVYVTAEYVFKTGDISILDEQVPFKLGEPLKEEEEERYAHYETSNTTKTLFEHCRRALEKGDTQGPHGLPLIGSGDWNDGMNRVGIGGKGESVWLGWFVYENLKRFAKLCEIQGNDKLAQQHMDRAEALKEKINQVAWDNEWFLRAYYDDGTLLGSHNNDECQIDSLPQSWAVLTQGAPENRQREALDAIEKHLVQRDAPLIRLFTPPFDETEKDPGYIKGYPPGIRENGGQYTHAAIWAVWALTELGLGNKAYEQFNILNPATHSMNIEEANKYKVEPYVVAADIYSTPPFIGRGGWTWYTGSSGWLYRLGTEAILGFKLLGDHFTIDPCIPHAWDVFHLTFRKNGCTYEIVVKNPEHVENGVKHIQLDGEIVDNHMIPILQDQSTHTVTVFMGADA